MLPEESAPGEEPPTYSVTFPSTGNFKFVCLIHADMTGVVHVVAPSTPLPHTQNFYDRETRRDGERLLADASSLGKEPQQPECRERGQRRGCRNRRGGDERGRVPDGVPDALRAADHRRARGRHGGVDQSRSIDQPHGDIRRRSPLDPRPASGNVSLTSDGAQAKRPSRRRADNVNSGFLSPTPQDRANLAQANPGVTRFRVTFTVPGTFNYICAVHDQLGMAGTVIVQ